MIQIKNLQIYIVTLACFFTSCTNNAQNAERVNDPNTAIDTLWTNIIEQPNSYWEKELTDKQYFVLREKGTEYPFSHPLNNNKKQGIYVCAACNNPLFNSNTKFNSGTGWPSFYESYFTKSVNTGADKSLGMSRDEVVCGRCGGHLGHVFNDGPKPTGLRYCINGEALTFVSKKEVKEAVFAQGCFWCVEEIFEAVKGVDEVISGYSGGNLENPTYELVGSGNTNHAEAVSVRYDPTVISYEELLRVYFNSGDITQVNGQGNDRGKQYRSIIFYSSDEEKKQIENYMVQLEKSGQYSDKIAVEILPFERFYVAEDYHQDYVKLHPNQGYVRSVSIPRYKKAIKHFPDLLKK